MSVQKKHAKMLTNTVVILNNIEIKCRYAKNETMLRKRACTAYQMKISQDRFEPTITHKCQQNAMTLNKKKLSPVKTYLENHPFL